jgi:hypothetical protein
MDARGTDTSSARRPAPNSRWDLLEFVICVGIITSILAVSVKSFFAYAPHMRQLGALMLATSAQLYMVEYRAAHGEWPTAVDPGDKNLAENSFFSVRTRAGAMDFTFSEREPALAGQVLTVRAWQSADGANLPIVWSCGRAQAGPLVPAAEDYTSLPNADLVSPCRMRYP